jgi:sugar phosphate permease
MIAVVRSILAVGAGLVLANVVIFTVQILIVVLFPYPEGVERWNADSVKAHIDQHGFPTDVLLFVLIGYALGAFMGGLVAAWIARRAPAVHAGAIAVLLMAASVMNMLSIPHPVWFWIGCLTVFLPFALMGMRLAPVRSQVITAS